MEGARDNLNHGGIEIKPVQRHSFSSSFFCFIYTSGFLVSPRNVLCTTKTILFIRAIHLNLWNLLSRKTQANYT